MIEESDILRLDGTRLYVMNRERGLSVVDVSTPTAPGLVARLVDLAGRGGELYLHRKNLLALVEDSDLPCQRRAPGQLTTFPTTAIAAVASPATEPQVVVDRCVTGSLVTSRLVGDILYVVTNGGTIDPNHGWLFSLDASNPSALTVVESVELAGRGHQVHVTDTAVFLAEQDGLSTRVRLVDISAGDGSMVERGSIVVPGLVPGRFHLDASGGTFRVVTRIAGLRTTQLSVIDLTNPDQPALLSSLPNIAPGEELFATRFMGDRAYVVTYKPEVVVNTVTVILGGDPLWVISLEDPRAPRVLGHLEIPGWSDYVFPRGDKLFAVGRGTDGNRVAASLFDVADPTRPTELKRLEFGAARASSEARSDFRAVEILENDLGGPPLALVPYSNNFGVGPDCVPEHHLQLIEIGDSTLELRGDLVLNGRVLRGFAVGPTLYGLTTREVATIDASNRDAPAVEQSVIVGDPGVREACEIAPEAPRVVVTTVNQVWASPPVRGRGGDTDTCACALSARCAARPAIGVGLGGFVAFSLLAFARRSRRRAHSKPFEGSTL